MEHIIADETFTNIDFRARPLDKGEYENCTFNGCDFSDTDLSGIRFISCVFTDCNLSLVKLNRTAFREVDFRGCKMLGLPFDRCHEFGLAFRFEGCSIDHSSFYQTKIRKTVFKNSQLRETDFTECDLTGASFEQCDLTNATFDQTILEKADFRTAYQYSIDPERNRIKKARFALSGLPGLLTRYDIQIDSAR